MGDGGDAREPMPALRRAEYEALCEVTPKMEAAARVITDPEMREDMLDQIAVWRAYIEGYEATH